VGASLAELALLAGDDNMGASLAELALLAGDDRWAHRSLNSRCSAGMTIWAHRSLNSRCSPGMTGGRIARDARRSGDNHYLCLDPASHLFVPRSRRPTAKS
jgi:hypothetical protein